MKNKVYKKQGKCRGALVIFSLLLALFCLAACGGGGRESGVQSGEVKMTARISEVGEYVVVEVIESEYTVGTHWVITSEDTVFIGRGGERISRGALCSGDTVEISYNGQVMLSYPPKIVAKKIALK